MLSSHRSRARRNSQQKPKTGSSWCLSKLWMGELPRQDQTLTLQPAKWMYTVLQIDIELKKSELRRKKRLYPVLWQFQLFVFGCFVIDELKPTMLMGTPQQNISRVRNSKQQTSQRRFMTPNLSLPLCRL